MKWDDAEEQQAAREPAPQPAALTPSIERLHNENREERRLIHQIVGAQWGEEVRNFFGLWMESMRTNWNFEVAPEIAKRVGEFIVKNNLNPLRHQTYDKIRLAFGKFGWMPDFRTESEKLADLIEGSDLNDHSVRLAINSKQAAIDGRLQSSRACGEAISA